MRTLSLPPLSALLWSVLLSSILSLSPMPTAVAQQRDDGVADTALSADAVSTTANTSATAPGRDGNAGNTSSSTGDAETGGATAIDAPRSGFGQVMSVLTGLLHDAAQREATGDGDGFALDNPAIEISVTPVEGQTSLLRASTPRHASGEGRRGERGKQLAGGTAP